MCPSIPSSSCTSVIIPKTYVNKSACERAGSSVGGGTSYRCVPAPISCEYVSNDFDGYSYSFSLDGKHMSHKGIDYDWDDIDVCWHEKSK